MAALTAAFLMVTEYIFPCCCHCRHGPGYNRAPTGSYWNKKVWEAIDTLSSQEAGASPLAFCGLTFLPQTCLSCPILRVTKCRTAEKGLDSEACLSSRMCPESLQRSPVSSLIFWKRLHEDEMVKERVCLGRGEEEYFQEKSSIILSVSLVLTRAHWLAGKIAPWRTQFLI